MEYAACSSCGGDVTHDSDFCPHCGMLFAQAGAAACETHGGNAAIGVCIICRKLICRECGQKVRGKMLCDEHRKIEVQQDWAKVFQSSDINESEFAKSFLESNGFKVLGQNFAPIGYVWDGGGDSALSRSAFSKPAKVFVPIPEYLRAAEALKEWSSGTPEPEEEGSDNS